MADDTKQAARTGNTYLLNRLGSRLRKATSDIAQQELPKDILRVLRQLEKQAKHKQAAG